MSENALDFTIFHTRVHAAARSLIGLGAALAVIGVAAILFPMFSTLVAAGLVGWVLLTSGVLMFFMAFSFHGTGPFFGALLVGILSVVAGAFLAFNPEAGSLGLTILLGAVFLIQGTYEMAFGMEMRPRAGWFWMVLSGLASVVLAIIIAAGLPTISAIALGIVLGVNLLSTGIGYVMVGLAIGSAR